MSYPTANLDDTAEFQIPATFEGPRIRESGKILQDGTGLVNLKRKIPDSFYSECDMSLSAEPVSAAAEAYLEHLRSEIDTLQCKILEQER